MEFTLDTDFSKLDGESAHRFMANFCDTAYAVFSERDEKCKLLGNLLLLARFINAVRRAIDANGVEFSKGITKAYDTLWDYLEGKMQTTEFEEFANNLSGFYSNYILGTEFDVPESFYKKYVSSASEITVLEINLFEWCDFLLLAVVCRAGWHMPYFEENCPEGMENIDFGGLLEMLDLISDMCIELCGIQVPSSRAVDLLKAEEQLYKTPLYLGIIANMQNDLKTALDAKPEQYHDLRSKYETLLIMPEEYAVRLPLDY